MAKLTKKQAQELAELKARLRGAYQRIEQLETENEDLRGELAPSSEQGAAYQSKLACMEALLHEMGVETATLVDHLIRARHALDSVCSAAAQQDGECEDAQKAEEHAKFHIMATMTKARGLR